MVQNEGPERTGVRTLHDEREAGSDARLRVEAPGKQEQGLDTARPFNNEDAAAVLQALDPFWTRGIVTD